MSIQYNTIQYNTIQYSTAQYNWYCQLRSLGDMMAPPDVGSLGRGVTQGPEVFVF